MSISSIKITALNNIGNSIAFTTLVPVVNMAGNPTTEKANLQILGNLVLSGAGGLYFAKAAQAINAETVSNAAQPAITSVGTLTSLTVSGNSNLGSVSNVTITGGTAGYVLSTNGSGVLSWASPSSGASGISGFSGFSGIDGASGFSGYSGVTGARTYEVSNSGASAYLIDGASNPTLNLLRGFTYTFSINASGHPFWIQTVAAPYSAGDIYNTGVTNNGAAVGQITFEVPYNTPSTLYYVCQFHSSMAGTINITDLGPEGASGISGFSGISGTSGIDGASGFSGVSGFSGQIGESGFSGQIGESGFSGQIGESGFSGISGFSGVSGINGASGFSGVSGFSGQIGESGFSGISGFSGVSGIDGASGFSGISGFSGAIGSTGPGMIYINTGMSDLLETVLTVNELDYRIANSGIPQIKANSETQGVVWSTVDNANTVLTAGTSLGLANVETGSYSNLTATALDFVGYSSVALITIPASGNGYRATFIRSVTASGDRGGIVVEQIFG